MLVAIIFDHCVRVSPFLPLQNCSFILLDEKLRAKYLRQMRSPRVDHLKKTAMMKAVVKKCSTMASGKDIKCIKCHYLNGLGSVFYLG